MNYYRFCPDCDRFNGVWCVDAEIEAKFSGVFYNSPRSLLNEIGVVDLKEEVIEPFDLQNEGDFPFLFGGYTPILSIRAWQVLEPLISRHVERFSATHPRGNFVVLNIPEFLDAVDLGKSNVLNIDRPDIRGVQGDLFFLDYKLLSGRHICRTAAGLIVDDVFRSAVQTHDLRGLVFSPLGVINASDVEC